jgi:alkyl hydroperoxide reductase subunit AhpC
MHAKALVVAATALAVVANRHVSPSVGQPAPVFAGVDTHGRAQSLAAYRGKWVVLEWFNYQCPYTIKHYTSGNMQSLQRAYAAKGVAWLTIESSPRGTEGYADPVHANKIADSVGAAPTAIIRDTTGAIGRLYGATNTPNMFVIDPRGVLVYAGAIDDKRTADTADVKGAHNYVRAALDAAMAGAPVTVQVTQPYGCVIPYVGASK